MLKYMFLDESGDLGFGVKSSRFFTVTLLVCEIHEEQELQRIIKKIRQRILKKKLKQATEIKWNNSSEEIKQRIFQRLEKINFEVFTIILDKSKVYDYLKEKKHKLYNYLSKLIIAECSIDGKFELIVDRSKGKRSLRDDFNNYIRENLKEECQNLSITHEDSKSSGSLQVLDFISGAIFNKYEFNNLDYYNMIRNKITTEKEFP
ncbi:DUF3800 domain-containing protein [Candidatus Pacearchaeota archaeon]|nr:DUF3800 domain-containing protein [Candidatus Pacearchaeota archaeon]